jgi:hypothetical protein
METLPNQTPSTPEKKTTPFSGIAMVTIAVAALITLGATALFVLRRPNQPTMPAISDIKTDSKTQTDTSSMPKPTPTPTSTPQLETTTTVPTQIIETDETILLGETFQIFKGDTVKIRIPSNTNPRWSIKAISFGDSRCPADVQCIWAGEQNVTLTITDLIARTAPQDITLGTERNPNQSIFGLTLKLKTIEDGKGGTYAEIETK